MELSDLKAWFGALSRSKKVVALLDIMHGLTLVARGIFYEESLDPRRRMELLFSISEMDHRFTSAARDMFHGVETFPDDVLMEILALTNQPELQAEMGFVARQAIEMSQHPRERGSKNG